MGDSGAGLYNAHGLVGIYLGHSKDDLINGKEYARVVPWGVLKAFGIPVSGGSVIVKPDQDGLLPLPGTEDVKAPPKGGDSTKEEVPAETTAEEPKKEVTDGTRRTPRGSTEADNEDGHEIPTDLEPEGRGSSSVDDSGQGSGQRDAKGRDLKTGTASEPHVGKGASLPPTAPNKGSGSSSEATMEILISALLGAAGIATTGGTGVAIYYGAKGLASIYRRRKRKRARPSSLADDLQEVLGRPAASFPHIPGREVDEIGELLQLAQLEGFDPLMGSAFGLFAQDEITRILSDGTEEEKAAIRKLRDRVTDRIHAAAPLVKGQ